MTRRSASHDYTRPGIYHITLHVADGLGQPLGAIAGSLFAPDGSIDAPHTALSPVGQMVEHELLHTIHKHYAMITIQDYVIMPEHLPFLAVVQDKLLSPNGKTQSLGQVIASFKQGCNRRYWEITQRAKPVGTLPLSANSAISAIQAIEAGEAFKAGGAFKAGRAFEGSVPGGFAAGKVRFSSGRQPLFAPGFCDVMPVDERQLATQRAYIAANPRSRLLRTLNRVSLSAQRGGIDTALTPSALRNYLRRECGTALTPEAWETIDSQLLKGPDATITCDSFGDRRLLGAHLLPVVCHRKDAARFGEQKARCLEAAAQGAVLVSPRIAKGEQEIIDESVNRGLPAIIIVDNGLPDRYHPSQEGLDRCAEGRILLVTPWQYQYRGKNEQVTVPFCKAMNCVAQAICRTKDSWWKEV